VTARLPIIDNDLDQWGTVLNDYLGVALTGSGTVKSPLSVYTSTTSLLSVDAIGAVTSATVARIYFTGVDDPGSHGAQARSALAVTHRATGSGSNGPVAMDAALFLSAQKLNYTTSSIQGQVSAGNIYVRQGLKGDASGFDINVAGFMPSSYFYCTLEGLTTRFNAAQVVVDQVDVQIGVVAPNIVTMGYFADRFVGTGGEALRLAVESGAAWDNFINVVGSGGQSLFQLDGNGRTSFRQGANNTQTLVLLRQTDSAPDGSLIECVNAANNLDLFVVKAVDPPSGFTSILVGYNTGSGTSVNNVTVGASDTGGAGYRVLRVPN